MAMVHLYAAVVGGSTSSCTQSERTREHLSRRTRRLILPCLRVARVGPASGHCCCCCCRRHWISCWWLDTALRGPFPRRTAPHDAFTRRCTVAARAGSGMRAPRACSVRMGWAPSLGRRCLEMPPAVTCCVTAIQPNRQLSMESGNHSLLSPTEVHSMLREAVRQFAEEQVDPQALEHDKEVCMPASVPAFAVAPHSYARNATTGKIQQGVVQGFGQARLFGRHCSRGVRWHGARRDCFMYNP